MCEKPRNISRVLIDVLEQRWHSLQNISEVNTCIHGAIGQVDQDHQAVRPSFFNLELANHQACQLIQLFDGEFAHSLLNLLLILEEVFQGRQG